MAQVERMMHATYISIDPCQKLTHDLSIIINLPIAAIAPNARQPTFPYPA